MVSRCRLTIVALCTLWAIPSAHSDIYRWDTGEVIPGTEGIEPGPQMQLAGWNSLRSLEYADFSGGLDLSGSDFYRSWLDNADFSGANLTKARLHADLDGANLAGANLTDADLVSAKLRNANLSGANLERASLAAAILTGSDLSDARLANAYLGTPRLGDVNMTGAIVTGTYLGHTTPRFTKEQLYSTASYQQENLRRIQLHDNDLQGWSFAGQDLTNANLAQSNLTNADLTGAGFRNANVDCEGLLSAVADSTTSYNQWTVFPDGFAPDAAGFTLVPSPAGDFDANNVLNSDDVDRFNIRIHGDIERYPWHSDAMFDLNEDGRVSLADHRIWVKGIKQTWFGDANLDGAFDSGDLAEVFAAGEYEQGSVTICDGDFCVAWNRVSWAEGDWNADGMFDSSDMVAAFVDGGYEKGPRTDAAAVPEPGGWLLLLTGLAGIAVRRRRLRS